MEHVVNPPQHFCNCTDSAAVCCTPHAPCPPANRTCNVHTTHNIVTSLHRSLSFLHHIIVSHFSKTISPKPYSCHTPNNPNSEPIRKCATRTGQKTRGFKKLGLVLKEPFSTFWHFSVSSRPKLGDFLLQN